MRLAVLDDEKNCREAFNMILNYHFTDLKTEEYSNGDEFCAAVSRGDTKIDLLIADYGHPGKMGAQFFQFLVENKVTFPVLILSAYVGGVPGLQQEIESTAGIFVRCLHKPFDVQAFRQAVIKAVSRIQT